MPSVIEKDCLYYPYIHVRDVDFLKANLLMFPHMQRIVPPQFDLQDNPEIGVFARTEGRRGMLLQEADIFSATVEEKNDALLRKMKEDITKDAGLFKRTFDRHSIKGSIDDNSFLMNENKITDVLLDFLRQHDLAWEVDPQGRDMETIGLHPAIGEAIMATIAAACSADSGLDIVSDRVDIHYALAERDIDQIYEAMIAPHLDDDAARETVAAAPKADDLFSTILVTRCDLTKVTAESIAALSDDRGAIAALRRKLSEFTATVPEMTGQKARDERVKALAHEALSAWTADRLNASRLFRSLWTDDSTKGAQNFAKEIMTRGAPFVVGAGGAATFSAPVLLAAASGLAVMLATGAVTGAARRIQRQKTSSYRYLTQIEKAGAVFSINRLP